MTRDQEFALINRIEINLLQTVGIDANIQLMSEDAHTVDLEITVMSGDTELLDTVAENLPDTDAEIELIWIEADLFVMYAYMSRAAI